jgi:hypothetical protein
LSAVRRAEADLLEVELERYRTVDARPSENMIKPPTEQFDTFAEQLSGLKSAMEGALVEAGLRGLDLLSYALEQADELPTEGASEEVAKERHLRIAGCALLEDVPSKRLEQVATRSVGDVYENDLMGPLRSFFDFVERTTADYSYEQIGTLVEHAGARVFKGLDTGRSFDRRVGVALHILLARTRGYPRP